MLKTFVKLTNLKYIYLNIFGIALNFIEYLKYRINNNLPGEEAQKAMAPSINSAPYRNFKPMDNAKASAVLIILFPDSVQNNYKILLTLRSKSISHSGQISFPGGRVEANESNTETALREANEEIGLIADGLEIIGELSTLYVPPSNNIITPVLAYSESAPVVGTINTEEVQEIIITDIHALLNEDNLKKEMWTLGDREVEVPHWTIHETPLWGATAMLLSELLNIYKELTNQN